MDAVLGPGARGVVLLADVPDEALRHPLAEAGLPSATPVELGLSVQALSAPGPEDRPGLARFLAEATRRPTVTVEDGGWVVAAPDGEVLHGGDPARLAADAAGRPLPRRVAVFGGAWTAEDHPEYEEVRRLGALLAERGAQIVCGGYQGVMAAACRGAKEAGGTTVGVTISAWEDVVEVNAWLTHEIVARDMFARLPLISDADAWVAFPGGVGTLGEVSLCWNLVQTGLARARPLVVVGEPWSRTMRLFRELLRVSDPGHFDLVRSAATVEEVIEALGPALGRG